MTLTNRQYAFAAAIVAFYAICYCVFYPQIYTSLDESANYGMAYVLRHGTIYPERAGYDLSMDMSGPHGKVFRFPIGLPLILSFASFVGPWAMFLINPFLHILAALAFVLILRRLNLPPAFAVLYLFYPGFSLYSRTLFSDPMAASLTTIAIALSLSEKKYSVIGAGLSLGLAALSRSTSILLSVLFLLSLIIEDLRSSPRPSLANSKSIQLAIGLAPFVIAILVYNVFTMGSPLKSTYSASDLTLTNFIKLGPLYFSSLLLIYPGMFFAPYLYKGPLRTLVIAGTTITFLIASSYHESTYGDNRLESLVAVSRQILPALPLYLLAYSAALAPLFDRSKQRSTIALIAAGTLAASCLAISYSHQRKLFELVQTRKQLYASVPANCTVYANKDIFKLCQPTWGKCTCRDVLTELNGKQIADDMKQGDCYVVLWLRSRGVSDEDGQNVQIQSNIKKWLVLGADQAAPDCQFHVYRIEAIRPANS